MNSSVSDRSKETRKVRLLILGSGPAGLSAALYAARAELKPVVLTGMQIGGQAALTAQIENYPGFVDGISGAQLGEIFQKQAEKFGARFEIDTVETVDLSRRPFKISAQNFDYYADALILATGAGVRKLGVPGEMEFIGRGVSYCATCDGWFFKEKEIVVVGGGDSAVEEAFFLTHFARKVTVIHRRDTLRAGTLLIKRAMENPKIHFLWNTIVDEIIGDQKVTGLRITNQKTKETSLFKIDGIFIFIGSIPNSDLFKGQLDVDENGHVVIDKFMRTNVEGVFAAGEISDSLFRQVITSAGMGAAAAIQATRFLENH